MANPDIVLIEPPNPTPLTSFPLGLASLGANLRKHGFDPVVLDCNLEASLWVQGRRFDFERFGKLVESQFAGVQAFGIRSVTPTHWEVKQLVATIRRKVAGCYIIVGGPHVSATPRETLTYNPAIDVVVVGEGEITLVELMRALQVRRSLESVAGLAIRRGKRIAITGSRALMAPAELDQLPFDYDGLADRDDYVAEFQHGQRSAAMLTSRGCPFVCGFCSSCQHWGRRTRYRSVESVIEELKYLVQGKGIRRIYFEDDIFNLIRDRVLELTNAIVWENLHRRGRGFNWHCECRIDLLDREQLVAMYDAGCRDIFFGLETFDRRGFEAVKMGVQLDFEKYMRRVEEVLGMCKELGIESLTAMMIGLPYEDERAIERNVAILKRLRPATTLLSFLNLYPGAPLFMSYSQEPGFEWLSRLTPDIYERPEGVEEEEVTHELGSFTGHGARGIKPRYLNRDAFEQGRIEYDLARMRRHADMYRVGLGEAGLHVEDVAGALGTKEGG